MFSINPYLNFMGNTEEAFNFYKSVFGGEFSSVNRFKDTPQADNMPDNEKEMLMHIALPVGKNTVLMGTDALESMGHTLNIGDNIQLSIHTESESEADKIFNALSADGKITLPMQKMFWNSYFGMLTDKFGIKWMVSYDYPQK